MADIYNFPTPKPIVKDDGRLNDLRQKLLFLHETRDAINREIRYTKDAINLLEKGEQ